MEDFGPIFPDSYYFLTMGTILSYMAKERFYSYRGRHVELCKCSTSVYTEKGGSSVLDNLENIVHILLHGPVLVHE